MVKFVFFLLAHCRERFFPTTPLPPLFCFYCLLAAWGGKREKQLRKGEQTALHSCLWLWSIDAQSILRLNSPHCVYLPIWGCPPPPLLFPPSQVLYSNVTSISYAAQMWLELVRFSFTAHLMLPHNDAVDNCAGFSNWSFSWFSALTSFDSWFAALATPSVSQPSNNKGPFCLCLSVL